MGAIGRRRQNGLSSEPPMVRTAKQGHARRDGKWKRINFAPCCPVWLGLACSGLALGVVGVAGVPWSAGLALGWACGLGKRGGWISRRADLVPQNPLNPHCEGELEMARAWSLGAAGKHSGGRPVQGQDAPERPLS